MPLLTATFELEFPQPLLLRASPGIEWAHWIYESSPDHFHYDCIIGEFQVNLWLSDFSPTSESIEADNTWTGMCTGGRVDVAREEKQEPPEPVTAPNGSVNVTPLWTYLRERQHDYEAAARTCVNRLFGFFRYEKSHPFLDKSDRVPFRCYANPLWTEEGGELVWCRRTVHAIEAAAAMWLSHHRITHPFEDNERVSLSQFLQEDREATLERQILAQALDAFADKDPKRAIIFMAIACEVALKRALFVPGSLSSRAVEFLELRRRFKSSIDDLLQACEHASGHRFANRRSIVDLFRCRNAVVHHGYIGGLDGSRSRSPTHEVLLTWWNAAVSLLSYCQRLNKGGSFDSQTIQGGQDDS